MPSGMPSAPHPCRPCADTPSTTLRNRQTTSRRREVARPIFLAERSSKTPVFDAGTLKESGLELRASRTSPKQVRKPGTGVVLALDAVYPVRPATNGWGSVASGLLVPHRPKRWRLLFEAECAPAILALPPLQQALLCGSRPMYSTLPMAPHRRNRQRLGGEFAAHLAGSSRPRYLSGRDRDAVATDVHRKARCSSSLRGPFSFGGKA
jgi:hypothetical protein